MRAEDLLFYKCNPDGWGKVDKDRKMLGFNKGPKDETHHADSSIKPRPFSYNEAMYMGFTFFLRT